MSNSEKPNLSSISTNTGTASLNKAVSQIIQDELPKSIQNLSQRYDAYMNVNIIYIYINFILLISYSL